ncbi:hypothetical protein KPL40_19535 [Clostridium gasigenes]|uniref:hypothetical protein n=1 Tax=Clostridium gasigenes TaxID=94869 RepID=UPI001C0C1032|nr:hypothetical protein [Clostridium gasigenes]MBU3134601.1 hypothetical protein [Clostridium gasigenes]
MKLRKNSKLVITISIIMLTTTTFQLGTPSKIYEAKNPIRKSSVINLNKEVKSDKYRSQIDSGNFESDDIKAGGELLNIVINELRQIIMVRDKGNLEEYDRYVILSNGIEENKALYLELRLKNKFGSLKSTLDEYILSLQLQIDIEKCVDDKENYDREKVEQLKKIKEEQIITLDKIEETYLEKPKEESETNNGNGSKGENYNSNNDINISGKNSNEKIINGDKNIKVKKPTDDVIKEINGINNISIDGEGR